jgi:hypothetical protein
MIRNLLALALVVSSTSWALAGSWADGLFEELSKDFGPVPRGPTLEHSFRLVNRTSSPVHVSNVRVSCGCVQATASREDIAPGKEAAIIARMDTRRFTGSKSVTIYVTFDQPSWDEAQLVVQAYGRDDIAMSPDAFEMGRISKGTGPASDVNVDLRGGDWRILSGSADSNYVRVKVKKLNESTGEANYQVEARLRPDTPVGRWYTDVWLNTSDPQVPRLRIPLTVEVDPALTLTPQVAALGKVKLGGESERRLLLRGAMPFRVLRIEGSDDQVSARDMTPEARASHVLAVHIKATRPGEVTKNLRVVTDLKEDPQIEFQATASVDAAAAQVSQSGQR